MSAQRIVDFTRSGKPVTHGGSGNAYTNHGCRCDECTAANTRRVKRRQSERDARSGDFEHGASGYKNWACRCEVCSEAHSEMLRAGYASRKRRQAAAPHGTPSGYYAWACRCDACREAAAAYQRRRRQRAEAG